MTPQVHYPYDLFVFYANADQEWVQGYLLDVLTQAGVRYLSEAAFTLGVPRVTEFERAIRQSQRTLLVLSPAYLADVFNQFINVLAQSYGAQTNSWPVIPLKLRPVNLPPRLAMLTSLDATDSTQWPRVIQRLCIELQCPVPSSVPAPPCPYPGMVPFSDKDARFFYGRESEIKEMIQRLRHQRFLFVVGPSGSGQSSLVHAGLLPKLPQSSYFSTGFWLIQEMRPGATPLQSLIQLLGGADVSTLQPSNVQTLLADNPPAQRLLLVIDQFEELFTQTDRAGQSQFIAALQNLRAMANCYFGICAQPLLGLLPFRATRAL